MAYGAGGAAAAAAAHAIKATGAIVKVDPEEFQKLMRMAKEPLVVASKGGMFTKLYSYLFGYKGLVFYTKSAVPLSFAGDAQMIHAKSIWIPI